MNKIFIELINLLNDDCDRSGKIDRNKKHFSEQRQQPYDWVELTFDCLTRMNVTFETSVCTHTHACVCSESIREYNTCVSVRVHLNPCITYARWCLQCSSVLSMNACLILCTTYTRTHLQLRLNNFFFNTCF